MPLECDLDRLEQMVARWPRTGSVAVRFGVVVTFFFDQGGSAAKRLQTVALTEDFVGEFAADLTHYQPPGDHRLKRIKADGLIADLRAGAELSQEESTEFDPEGGAFEFGVYGFAKGERRNEPPSFNLTVVAMPPWQLAPHYISTLEIYLPAAWLRRHGAARLLTLVHRWADLLEPQYGLAGWGAQFDPAGSRQTPGLIAFPYLMAFPGLDYPDPGQWSVARGQVGGPLIPTTNWLNYVSNGFLEAVGGRAALDSLAPACRVHELKAGVLLEAGPEPRLFGTAEETSWNAYAAVARLLRPIRFEAYPPFGALFTLVPQPFDPLVESVRWVSRFDQPYNER